MKQQLGRKQKQRIDEKENQEEEEERCGLLNSCDGFIVGSWFASRQRGGWVVPWKPSRKSREKVREGWQESRPKGLCGMQFGASDE